MQYLYLGFVPVLPDTINFTFRVGVFFDATDFIEQLVLSKRQIRIHIVVAACFSVLFALNMGVFGMLWMKKRRARRKIQCYYALYIK